MRKRGNRSRKGKHGASAGRNKTVVIRQRREYRIFGTVFFLLLLLGIGTLEALIWIHGAEGAEAMGMVLLLFPIVIHLPLVLQLTTWKVTLHEHGIRKEVFGCTTRDYTWEQVRTIEDFKPSGEWNYIYVIFRDGKKLSFRIDFDNATEAKRVLLSRFSIVEKGRRQ